jgi:DNA-binding PadR family transcriptional regulator
LRTSQTDTAVLGALSVMPMTGYAVRESIRDVLGHFWNESFGQIYPALARLEKAKLIRREGGKRTASSVFAITPAGTERLRQLLSEPIQVVPPRNGLMLRLFFGRQIGPDACRALLAQARADAEQRLAGYQAIRHEIDTDDELAPDRPYWLLTISAGEHNSRAALAWVDESLAVLDNLAAGPETR